MNTYRIISFVLCMVMVCTLAACSEKPNGSSEQETYSVQEELQDNQGNSGDSSSTGHKVPPITHTFDTMSEVKAFFDESTSESGNSTETNGIKDISDYHTKTEANALADVSDTLLFPVLKSSNDEVKFGATWRPKTKCLDAIYIIDNVKYRFRYYINYINDHPEWNGDYLNAQDALDVQVGPYTIDFALQDHPRYEQLYVGVIQVQDTCIAIWALGNGLDRPSFEAFDFVPLSSIGGTDVA